MKLFLPFIAAIILLCGCQTGGNNPVKAEDLKGQWIALSELYMHLTLNDGGKLVYCKGPACMMGKWGLDGNKLWIKYAESEDNKETEMTLSIMTNGTLEWETPAGGKVIFFREAETNE